MKSQRIRRRVGDSMVTINIKVEPAVVAFEDLVAAVAVTPDGDAEPPWQDDDYLQHDLKTPDAVSGYSPDAVVWPDGRRKHVIVVDRDRVRKLGLYDRMDGESAQSAWERGERERRRIVAYVKSVYEDGVLPWTLTLKHGRVVETRYSVWDVDDGPWLRDEARELAGEVARRLAARGYTVTGRPTGAGANRRNAQAWRAHRWGFKDAAAYQAWLAEPAPLPEPWGWFQVKYWARRRGGDYGKNQDGVMEVQARGPEAARDVARRMLAAFYDVTFGRTTRVGDPETA